MTGCINNINQNMEFFSKIDHHSNYMRVLCFKFFKWKQLHVSIKDKFRYEKFGYPMVTFLLIPLED